MHGADLIQSTRGEDTGAVVVDEKYINRIDWFATNVAILGNLKSLCSLTILTQDHPVRR